MTDATDRITTDRYSMPVLRPEAVPAGATWPKVLVGDYYIDAPHPGSRIYTARSERIARTLNACECPEFASFRLESETLKAFGNYSGVACEVEVTGRTIQRHHGADVVAVKITWVNDGEPNDESTGCYMLVTGRTWVGHYGPDEAV